MQESEWPIGTATEIAQEVAWFLEREPGNEATETGGLYTHNPGPDSITRSQFRSRASVVSSSCFHHEFAVRSVVQMPASTEQASRGFSAMNSPKLNDGTTGCQLLSGSDRQNQTDSLHVLTAMNSMAGVCPGNWS